MIKDLGEIRERLVSILREHEGDLKITADTADKFEVTGTKEAMQGKKKVDGIYFATVLPKPKDVRFYFFPAYTHVKELGELPENVKKCLKGKSCFYIKNLDDDLENNLKELVKKSVNLYKKDGLM